jgi:lysyl-tRNA synthetase class 2
MSGLDEVRAERIKKLNILKERGINAYLAKVERTHVMADALANFDTISEQSAIVSLVGRVMVIRGQGAIMFVVLKDASGTIQAVFKEDTLDEASFSLFKDVVDGGDFIEVTGTLFVTQRGEKSVLVEGWKMVSKSLLPLPDKYHGLQDEEERLRKRYLDLLTRDELREMFKRKEKFWDVTRAFMKEQGFVEVETPTLEVTTGGAEARPFATHHNDFDMDVFLRISIGELWQKRLLAGGFEKTFEIGRAYRNEGSSPNHLQEFTNLEFYQAFADYEDGMKLVENLYRTIAQEVYGTTKFTRGEYTFDLHDEWVRIDYASEIKKQTGIDIMSANEEEIATRLSDLGVKYEGTNKERLTDTLWKYCRKNIAGPAFLINHPKLVSPLAKEVPGNPSATQRFQPIIAGTEVGNGYSELNDPLEQQARFDLQQELIDRGDAEAMMPDFEFVEMLEHGMPPACGFGFGERLFTILEGKPIRDVQLFPLVKPKTKTE